MSKFCCDALENHINTEVAITYTPKFREYGILIDDGGTSLQLILFCPWCGKKLPSSLRDDWFDIVVDQLGIENTDLLNVPEEMKSDKWWRDGKIKS